MKNLVFKVERPQVAFKAELSNGKSVELTYLAPNARQARELVKSSQQGKELEASEKLLRESIKGEAADEFVDDLLENGSLDSFLNAITAQLAELRKAKTKN